MKIIDWYLLKRFALLLLGIVFSCQVIFLVVDFIGNLDRYLNAEWRYVLQYYFYLLPYITVVVFPIAMLLAAMFTTGVLAMHNEITAMQAAGVSIARIVAPLFAFSALICVVILVFSETVLPAFHSKKTEVHEYVINKRDRAGHRIKHNFYYQGKNGVMYRFLEFNGNTERGRDVMVEKYRDGMLISRMKADSMRWEQGKWVLYNGSRMQFEGETMAMTRFEREIENDLLDKPTDFVVRKKNPDDMNIFELRRFIDRVRRGGGKAYRYEADLHFKISYPIINLIVVILGVSLTTKVGRRGLAKVFGVGLAACFTYYVLAKLGLAAGHSGDVNPLLAAWLGNIVFSTLGVILFVRASR